ncbi:hypothetical protein chiPu_0009972 [Chiloscyllium punctatum]|uniref:Anaphase-promoting complex subunit 4 WD40 domain-containing protein n=1 Tax=Chiloscyllium punctatum TaxID=137246 RepID=A0A401SM78_CHIPU|nr:hypothetical protein [Chiloscyllium punctatum]
MTRLPNDLESYTLWKGWTVRRYEGHHNRCHPCKIALSPCGRFLVTGSEDKCAYLFELGSSNFVHKLSGHTETVITLAYSSSAPKVIYFFLFLE